MRNILVVVDMQNDFLDEAVLGTREAKAILPCVVSRLEAAQEAGDTIFFTQDTHTSAYLQTHEGKNLPVPHCIAGTEGWKLHPALAAFPGERVEKPTFASTALVDKISPLSEAGGANLNLTLCGVCTDICVVSNALLLRGHFPEAKITVYADSSAGTSPERHQAALDVMRSCHIEIE